MSNAEDKFDLSDADLRDTARAVEVVREAVPRTRTSRLLDMLDPQIWADGIRARVTAEASPDTTDDQLAVMIEAALEDPHVGDSVMQMIGVVEAEIDRRIPIPAAAPTGQLAETDIGWAQNLDGYMRDLIVHAPGLARGVEMARRTFAAWALTQGLKL